MRLQFVLVISIREWCAVMILLHRLHMKCFLGRQLVRDKHIMRRDYLQCKLEPAGKARLLQAWHHTQC